MSSVTLPDKPPSLLDIRDLLLAAARRSGSWRNAGIAIFEQLDSLSENDGEMYCAVCLALGLVAAREPLVGQGMLFAAPLVAKALLSGGEFSEAFRCKRLPTKYKCT